MNSETDLRNRLREIVNEQQPALTAYAWPSEANRWAELVFCILSRLHRDPEAVRFSIDLLFAAGLLDIGTLLAISDEGATTFTYILTSHGWPRDTAARALNTLRTMASSIQKRFAGKLQVAVRRFAEEMCADLVETLAGSEMDRSDLEYAVRNWLQNAFSLPVSLNHEAVQQFCVQEHVSLEELLHAADDLDLNVALLDDVLEWHIEDVRATGGE